MAVNANSSRTVSSQSRRGDTAYYRSCLGAATFLWNASKRTCDVDTLNHARDLDTFLVKLGGLRDAFAQVSEIYGRGTTVRHILELSESSVYMRIASLGLRVSDFRELPLPSLDALLKRSTVFPALRRRCVKLAQKKGVRGVAGKLKRS